MLPVHRHYPRSLGRLSVRERCAGAPAPLGRRRSPERRGLRPVPLLLVGLLAWGCSPEPAAFEGSAPSLDALAEHVLAALSSQDLSALDQVRLTEHEHNEYVWPELPAAAPEVNFPVDFAWSNIQTRNQSALVRVEGWFAGVDPTFADVECRGETEVFETFAVMTDCWVSFESEHPRGRFEAQIFKDVLVRGGGYKIFRYYDEMPRPRPSSEAD